MDGVKKKKISEVSESSTKRTRRKKGIPESTGVLGAEEDFEGGRGGADGK